MTLGILVQDILAMVRWIRTVNGFQSFSINKISSKPLPQHKVSWRHLCSKHWHQLDLILVRYHQINDVLFTRSYHSADCNNNHSLVCCKMHISKKVMHKLKDLTRKMRLNIVAIHNKDMIKTFSALMHSISSSSDTSVSKSWSRIQESDYQNSLAYFLKKKHTNKD